jgi:hypothetical protein
MGMGRHHLLPVPRLSEHGRAEEGKAGGVQETATVSIPTAKPNIAEITTIPISIFRHWRLEKCKASYLAQGAKRQHSHQD